MHKFSNHLLTLFLVLTAGGVELAAAAPSSTIAEVEATIAESPRVAARPRPRRREVQAASAGEEEVDLSTPETATNTATAPATANPHGGATGVDPHFSVYFDLLLGYRYGKENLSFLNFHPLLFFEVVPTPQFIFSFEVNPTPRFYELDYLVTRNLTLRAGRIWIPFDDTNPHNLFGGMINTSRMAFGSSAYLPDVWADLGVGVKFVPLETKMFQLETQAYLVNGFQANGTNTFPDFSLTPQPGLRGVSDNNDNKSVGARVHAIIAKIVGVGFSFYTGRWSERSTAVSPLSILGADLQLRLPKTELRFGISSMTVTLSSGSTTQRSGQYVEFKQKLGDRDQYMILARVGSQDTDNSVLNDSDNTILGGGFRWKPNFVALSLEHYQDLQTVPGKSAYGFTFLRTIIQL